MNLIGVPPPTAALHAQFKKFGNSLADICGSLISQKPRFRTKTVHFQEAKLFRAIMFIKARSHSTGRGQHH